MPSQVLVNPESEEVKELVRWEMFPSKWTLGTQPGNPWRRGAEFGKPGCEYPKMLYVARRIPGSGKWATGMDEPRSSDFPGDEKGVRWNAALEASYSFNKSCRRIVNSEQEERQAKESGEGWQDGPKEALAWRENIEKMISNEAAERAYRDRNMSEHAKAEAKAFEEDNFGHQPTIPEKPVARRGRPRKINPDPAAV